MKPYYEAHWLADTENQALLKLKQAASKRENTPHNEAPSITDLIEGTGDVEHVLFFEGGTGFENDPHNLFAADDKLTNFGRSRIEKFENAFEDAKSQALAATKAFIKHLEGLDCHGRLHKLLTY